MTPQIDYLRLRLPGWAGRMRLAHLTDLHFGPVTPFDRQVEAVRLVNDAEPDLVVLTGDFVSYGHDYLDRLTGTLSGLETRTVAVFGSHDYRAGAKRLWDALDESGVEVLANAWTRAGICGPPLTVVGLDDYATSRHDPSLATRGLRGPALGLVHEPEAAPLLWARGVPLVLSGPGNARIPGRFQVPGWYCVDGQQLLVGGPLGSARLGQRCGHVSVLDLEGGAVVSPVVRPWDFRRAAA